MANDVKDSVQTPKKEISLQMLWHVFVANIIWICGVAILVAGVVGVYTNFFVKTRYRETLTFYVFNFTANSDYFSQTQTTAAATAADLCIEAARKEATLRQIVEKRPELLEVFGTTNPRGAVSGIASTLGASHESSSAFFEISITHENKALVEDLMAILKDEYVGIFQSLFSTENDKNGETASVGEIRLYDITEEPTAVRPPLVRNVFFAGAVAAVLVYAICFLVSLLDTMIYDEQTVKDNFSYPILGSVPEWTVNGPRQKRRRTAVRRMLRMSRNAPAPNMIARDYENMLLSKDTPFVVTEAFNLLRTNLSYSNASAETPVYAITSAGAGAGKSIIAANLALSFAQLGKRTLLVEGDMRMPVFYKIFADIDRKDAGLSELLTGNAETSVAVRRGILNEHLSIISAGRIPPNPTDLLAQPRVAELIREWKGEYDIILIDTPPIGEVSDAGVLSAYVTGYLINVRSEYSDVAGVQSAINALRNVDASIVGFVLNDVRYGTGGYHRPYYKKGYYYRHKHYGYYHQYYATRTDDSQATDTQNS